MQLVLLGSPGAGKGTLAGRLVEKYDLAHISTGDMIREAIASGSELGQRVKSFAAKGELVPDELVIEIVRARMNNPSNTGRWILDGFPRTIRQAEALDELLLENGTDLKIALEIRISAEEAIQRIINRRVCRDCGAIYNLRHYADQKKEACDLCGGELYRRADDEEETVRQRFAVYGRQTHPLVHYYAQSGRLFSLDGIKGVDEMCGDVERILEKFMPQETTGDTQ
ncbi:MAG TPA: adenylate kinase [Firmicutes bacterium]|nr:adenylate kinase [Bacillota bacterium]